MLKLAAGVCAVVGLALISFATLVLAVAHAPPPDASAIAREEIPAALLPVYRAAAATCPGLPWEVLAAVGAIESHHGRGHADPTTGQVAPPILGPPLDGRDGRARITDPTQPDGWARALGPMQFLSTTWQVWGRVAPGRPSAAVPDVHNAWDAIYGAAAYLCGSAGRITDLSAALFRYNHSHRYVAQVLAKADEYRAVVSAPGRLAWPVPGTVVSPFGMRLHPILGIWRLHAGIDIDAPAGSPVRAPAAGTVTATGGTGGCGYMITVQHADDLRTTYCHLSRIGVAPGRVVVAGQVIGAVGSTGLSTGPHLHLEVRVRGQLVDPTTVLVAR
ncbi:MAG: M23 family metallopeptidase [Chloroflexota bacterium]